MSLKSLKKKLADVDPNDLLEYIGLERERSTGEKMVPALAIFGAGVLVGVGLGLMLAPKPGRELRSDLRARIGPTDAPLGKPNDATAVPTA